jgi:CDP-4-dehydro-6-deoxyglucose reductase
MEIELPKGECFLETAPLNPLVLMAASTGVTQMKSILEHLLQQELQYPVYLYWGALVKDDLYLDEFFRSWTRAYPLLHYVPVVSEPEKSPGWRGRTGLLPEAVLQDFADLNDKTFYVSGSPGMVYATLDSFMSKGMPRQNMYSDMFSLAPRE